MMRVGNAKTVQATALQHLNAGADVVVAICFSQGAKMGVAVYDSFRKPQTLQIAEYPAQQYNGVRLIVHVKVCVCVYASVPFVYIVTVCILQSIVRVCAYCKALYV
eukprot:Lankesteria_metandrocarpae@DN4263_c1_g1_i2.p2